MIVYVDSSALIKRVVAEPESEGLDLALAGHVADQDVLVSSSIAWVEVERALRSIVSADLADLVITYDDRLAAAAHRNSLDVVAPAQS